MSRIPLATAAMWLWIAAMWLWVAARYTSDSATRVYAPGRHVRTDGSERRQRRRREQVRFATVLRRVAQESSGGWTLIQQRLQTIGLEISSCTGSSGRIVALARIEPIVIPDGILANLTLEQRLAWELQNRQDVRWQRILQVIPLRSPQRAVHVGTKVVPEILFQLHPMSVQTLLASPSVQSGTIQGQLIRLGSSIDDEDAPRMAVQVW